MREVFLSGPRMLLCGEDGTRHIDMPQGVNANTGSGATMVATDELGPAVVPLAVIARQQQRPGMIVLPIKRQGTRTAQGGTLQSRTAAHPRNNVGIALSIHRQIGRASCRERE